ncbi:tetratricopeptide repeat protein [Actinokineospora auranticolor]|uniref:Alpha/beta hydrolase family protein n=1 Tax=Actinokineospora auranticolor TaxID=155976 RepID=A0A2S6GK79_9PSEU|nr:alpha/beta fold hydrolase [Actinokineospora auranticolor]PPK65644.1 alpha/beta hydrolase family protein [Actinokineospora auranticolor]
MTAPVHIVFVHGLFSSPAVWNRFTELLETDEELRGKVRVSTFEYVSKKYSFRPSRRIPNLDDVADKLRTTYTTKLADAERVVIVGHSQGGLVVQRFVTRTLNDRQGTQLARIKHIVLYACPNNGSQFMLTIRKLLLFRNSQERALRPYADAIAETQRTVVHAVINATRVGDSECPIPFTACAGETDNVVSPASARAVFPHTERVEGDHRTIIQPDDHDMLAYRVLSQVLATVVPRPHPDQQIAEQPDPGPADRPRAAAEIDPHAAGTVTPPFGRLPRHLYGRDKVVAEVLTDPRAVWVLSGMGGCGKSSVALEITHRARRDGRRVWWVDETRLASGMRLVALDLGGSESETARAWRRGTGPDLVWRLLEAYPHPWLLVFDNVDNTERMGAGAPVADGTGWLRPLMSELGAVLVTSRIQERRTWGQWCELRVLRGLEPVDGAAVLMDHVPEAGTNEQARLLSADLGGLPLALRAAGDYLDSVREGMLPPTDGITDFATYRAAMRDRFQAPAGSREWGDEPLGLDPVREVFQLSLNLLTASGVPQAPVLLKLLGCLSVMPIPHHLLLDTEAATGSALLGRFTPDERRRALVGLKQLGLVSPQPFERVDDPRLTAAISLHPVVHGLLREDPQVRARRGEFYGLNVRMMIEATAAHEPDHAENWAVWDIIAPHAFEVCRAVLVRGTPPTDRKVVADALELTRLTVRYLIAIGLLTPARELLDGVLGRLDTIGFDRDDREVLGPRHEHGRIELEAERPGIAEREFREVVDARSKVLGEDHADTLASRHKLAKALLEQARWEEVEPLLRSIVRAEYFVRGPEHPDTLAVRHSLARTVYHLGGLTEAEAMIRDVLEVRERLWSRGGPETLAVYRTLGVILLKSGRAPEAERAFKTALAAVRKRDSPIAMNLRYSLAMAHLDLGRTEEVVEDLVDLLAHQAKVLGPEHQATGRTRELLERTKDMMTDS